MPTRLGANVRYIFHQPSCPAGVQYLYFASKSCLGRRKRAIELNIAVAKHLIIFNTSYGLVFRGERARTEFPGGGV